MVFTNFRLQNCDSYISFEKPILSGIHKILNCLLPVRNHFLKIPQNNIVSKNNPGLFALWIFSIRDYSIVDPNALFTFLNIRF
jgi:hypothetical protein